MIDDMLDPSVRLAWLPGPAVHTIPPEQGLLVSFTEYTARHYRDLWGIFVAAIRLRRQLLRLPGAYGVTLHAHPISRRSGSLTAWQTEADLQRFIGLPEHLKIMANYRDRGSIRSVTFRMSRFTPEQALLEGRRRLDAGKPA